MSSRMLAALLVVLLLSLSARPSPVSATGRPTILSPHWVPGWGFRDELNSSDIDYQNFWTDNAGKILATGIITNDVLDANRALGFIQDHMTHSHYLPEVIVNSSILHPIVNGESSIANRIVMLGESGSPSELQQLLVGDYYASPWTAGYLGADRIWYNGSAHRASSAVVVESPRGFVKRAYFSFDGLAFYTYLNATIVVGEPYARVSVQVQPLDSAFGPGDYSYLQVFAADGGSLQQYAFENATLYDGSGNPVGTAPFKGASHQVGSGILIAYSNRTNIFDQDSAMLRFNATGVYDIEHWYQNGAFGGLSWVGLGYDVPTTGAGKLSAAVYADVYPIEHLDSRLLADTVKYAASDPKDVAVSPPASFGFVARGLALSSNLDPGNQTLRGLAAGYWNFMSGRYQGMLPDRSYARATSVFALAGFELYGDNSTVENFTRTFVGGFDGASIEEHAWAASVLQTLFRYSGSLSDLHLLQDAVSSYTTGGNQFLGLAGSNTKANDTFEFGETASGLISGGQQYNSSAVLWAMNAVLQSNSTGVLLNRPYHGDLANTETIPDYLLSTFLFKDAMRSHTGYWVDWMQNTNITSIDYRGGQLELVVVGRNGTLALGTPNGTMIYRGINGRETIAFPQQPFPWLLLVETVTSVIGVVLLVIVYFLLRKARRRLTRPTPDDGY